MDIHFRVWTVKARTDGGGIVLVFKEQGSHDTIVAHLSRAAGRVVVEDVFKILAAQESEPLNPGPGPLPT